MVFKFWNTSLKIFSRLLALLFISWMSDFSGWAGGAVAIDTQFLVDGTGILLAGTVGTLVESVLWAVWDACFLVRSVLAHLWFACMASTIWSEPLLSSASIPLTSVV